MTLVGPPILVLSFRTKKMESGTGGMCLFFETHSTRMIYVPVRHWFWSRAKSRCWSIRSTSSSLVVAAECKWLHLDVGHLHLSCFLMKGSLPVAAESEMQPRKGMSSR